MCPAGGFYTGELAELTIQFYRRNLLRAVFVQRGAGEPGLYHRAHDPDLELLRGHHRFRGISMPRRSPGRTCC